MKIEKFVRDSLLKIKVIPNSSREGLVETGEGLKLYLKARAEKGKANRELIRFFKKEFNLKVEIEKGEKGREKVLRIFS